MDARTARARQEETVNNFWLNQCKQHIYGSRAEKMNHDYLESVSQSTYHSEHYSGTGGGQAENKSLARTIATRRALR